MSFSYVSKGFHLGVVNSGGPSERSARNLEWYPVPQGEGTRE